MNQDILSHPSMDLSLKQLEKERTKIIKLNKRLSEPNYPFKETIKPHYPQYLDELIRIKKEGHQLSLF